MVSNLSIIGIIFALAISAGVPILCVIYSGKRMNNDRVLFTVSIGALVSILSLSFTSSAIQYVYLLVPESAIDSNILYLIIYSIVIAILETLARALALFLTRTQGAGVNTSLALGSGFAFGTVFFGGVSTYITYLRIISEINKGTYLTSYEEQLRESLTATITAGADTGVVIDLESQVAEYMASAEQNVQTLIGVSPFSYFLEGINNAAIIFVQIAIFILLAAFINKNKKVVGLIATGGISVGYRFLLSILAANYNDTSGIMSKTSASILAIAADALLIGGSIWLIRYLIKILPAEKKAAVPHKVKKEEAIDKQKKKAWAEVNNLNTRNIPSPDDNNSNVSDSNNGDSDADNSNNNEIDNGGADNSNTEL